MNKIFIVLCLFFLFFSEIMLAQHNKQHTTSEIYNINKSEFLPHYFSVQEMKNNGWKRRLNIVHITDIHIGSEDADTNLQECIDLSKEKNMALSAIIGTGDLTIGLRFPKKEVLSYYHTCRDILMQSDIPTLFQLGNCIGKTGMLCKQLYTRGKFRSPFPKWTSNFLFINHSLLEI